MPDPRQLARSRQIIALALLPSALLLAGGAVLIYTGTLNIVAEGARGIVSIALGAAAVLDFILALWFFRMSQSS
jgi:hypothetical protein